MAVHVVDHPVITHKMTALRQRRTETPDFRRRVTEITLLLAYEATRDLPTTAVDIETPLCRTEARVLAPGDFVLAPILRAGLGMVQGMLAVLPEARVGHIGLKRDEHTAIAQQYYYNMPHDLERSTVIVLDPMLATAGSLCQALQLIKDHNPRSVRAICLIAAPEGKARIEREHPDVPVYVGAMDQHLNDKSFIVPGLGDAGDRMFGTL